MDSEFFQRYALGLLPIWYNSLYFFIGEFIIIQHLLSKKYLYAKISA